MRASEERERRTEKTENENEVPLDAQRGAAPLRRERKGAAGLFSTLKIFPCFFSLPKKSIFVSSRIVSTTRAERKRNRNEGPLMGKKENRLLTLSLSFFSLNLDEKRGKNSGPDPPETTPAAAPRLRAGLEPTTSSRARAPRAGRPRPAPTP